MKLKFILAIALFLGNLLVLLFDQQIHNLSNNVLVTATQRLLIRLNGIFMAVAALLVIAALYLAVS